MSRLTITKKNTFHLTVHYSNSSKETMKEHELVSDPSTSLPLDDNKSNAPININASISNDSAEMNPKTEYGRGKRTMQIDYKRLAGETYSYDSSEELMYNSFGGNGTPNTLSFSKSNSKEILKELSHEYANKHVPQVLFRSYDNDFIPSSFGTIEPEKKNMIQTVDDGSQLSLKNLVDPNHDLSIHRPILIKDTAESIGMKVPRGKTKQRPYKINCDDSSNRDNKSRNKIDDENQSMSEGEGSPKSKHKNKITIPITIREIGQKIGMDHPVSVMDVKTQDEMEGWIMSDLVEYFEDEDRLYQIRQYNHNSFNGHSRYKKKFTPSKQSKPRVLNQISLEFSNTNLRRFTMSPAFVRELDWIDTMWPNLKRWDDDGNATYPRVQYYCLTSTAGCYTDFHIDFGGTSVWYHVLSGKKVFLLIPPTKQNIALYESWLCSKHQPDIFFLDMKEDVVQNKGSGDKNETNTTMTVESCMRVTLEKNQTLIIPTGWIHAVYTPVDSIVLGGNFLHGLDIKGQLDIHCLETRTRVPAKFRFPYFVQLMFYAGKEYYKRMVEPYGNLYPEEVSSLSTLIEALRSWSLGPCGNINRSGSIAQVIQECVADVEHYGISCIKDLLDGLEEELKRIQANGYEKRPSLDSKENIAETVHSNGNIDFNTSAAPKLKLSLKRATPTKYQKELNGDLSQNSGNIELTENKIVFMKSKRVKIGDLSSKQHPVDDDEWLPGGGSKKSKSEKLQKLPKRINSKTSTKAKNEGRRKTAAVRKNKQTGNGARSRLKKKLGI